jgi:hypothetical protein
MELLVLHFPQIISKYRYCCGYTNFSFFGSFPNVAKMNKKPLTWIAKSSSQHGDPIEKSNLSQNAI